ncbi:MAG: hypothetical protein K9L56_13220 [Clostridiales bacterium]|nr:hypothetical protein [Clostridiales bacterium]
MSEGLKSKHDNEMIQNHIKIMNNNKNRSETNSEKLAKHEEKIDELQKVHSALTGIRSEMKNLSDKIDEVKTDKEALQEIYESRESQNKQFVNLIKSASKEIAESHKKTWQDRFEDAIVPVILATLIYAIAKAFGAGSI